MIRLPVHCCCDPARRLGSVPVPEDAIRRRVVRFAIVEQIPLRAGGDAATVTRDVLRCAIAPIEAFGNGMDGRRSFLAVKNEDHPITLWLKVPGFIEEIEP